MAVPFSENGGFAATALYLFVPAQDMASGQTYIGVFDPDDFNDDKDGSTYYYRQEDVLQGRMPTVRKVVITYRDLGLATITVALFATDDDQKVITKQVSVEIGNAVPTNALQTIFVNLSLTGYRPQLGIGRMANGGPVSIVSILMAGEVEEATL